jgi:hypothetical protein
MSGICVAPDILLALRFTLLGKVGVKTGPANASLMTSIGRSWLLPAGSEIGSDLAMISAPRAVGYFVAPP